MPAYRRLILMKVSDFDNYGPHGSGSWNGVPEDIFHLEKRIQRFFEKNYAGRKDQYVFAKDVGWSAEIPEPGKPPVKMTEEHRKNGMKNFPYVVIRLRDSKGHPPPRLPLCLTNGSFFYQVLPQPRWYTGLGDSPVW